MPLYYKPEWPPDGRAADGFLIEGWRRVRKGGIVKFAGQKFQHESLAAWAGFWVFVTLRDYAAERAIIYGSRPYAGEFVSARAVTI
jgi:hypothetical protein